MPTIAGFVNPIGRTPAFLIPLFEEYPRSNRLLLQRITNLDTVAGFEAFDDLRDFRPVDSSHAEISVSIGDAALYAFAFDSQRVLLGTSEEIKPELDQSLRRGELNTLPLLQAEVASFCNAEQILEQALLAAYESLGGGPNLGARVWRDVVILRPAACRDILLLAGNAGAQCSAVELDAVIVESSEFCAEVRLPLTLYKSLPLASFKELHATSHLASVFGLQVEVKAASRKAEFALEQAHATRAIGYPVSVLNRLSTSSRRSGAGNLLDYISTAVGPYGTIKSSRLPDERDVRFGRFVAFRNSEDMLADVGRPGPMGLHDDQVVGVIVQRVGFGSAAASTIPIGNMSARVLQNSADVGRGRPSGLFYVSGHVLQRSLKVAPELMASRRGDALALSAASAIMSLVYAKGVKSLRELLPRTTSIPLGIALRRPLARNETPIQALRFLLRQLLHPQVRIADCAELSFVISNSLDAYEEALIEELVASTGIEAYRVTRHYLPPHIGQRQISLVGMNLSINVLSKRVFGHFCQKLLAALGWTFENDYKEPTSSGIVASRQEVAVLFMPLIEPGDTTVAIDEMDRQAAALRRCIVTNFTVNEAMRKAAKAANCSFVHYSRLDEWFEFKVLGRPEYGYRKR